MSTQDSIFPLAYRDHWGDSGAFEIYPTHGGEQPGFGDWADIAEVRECDDGSYDAEEIARLFAASHDLLQALREARKVLAVAIRANWEGATDADVNGHLTIKQIDAAIARATRGN